MMNARGILHQQHCGSRNRSARVATSGAVTVEALCVVLLFIILFAGILYVKDVSLGKLRSAAAVRSCVWEYAANGCTERPERCAGILQGKVSMDVGETVAESVGLDELQRLQSGSSLGKVVYDVLEPVLEKLLSGQEFAPGEARMAVSRPAPFGGDVVQVGASYRLRCNLAPKDPVEMLEDIWDTTVSTLSDEIGL